VLTERYQLKVNAISRDNHLRLENRVTTQAREDRKLTDRARAVRADTVMAQQTLVYRKQFDVIWLIQHSRIGGSVDVRA
jgi:hypothetical protein